MTRPVVPECGLDTIEAIVAAAVGLGAEQIRGWSPAETKLVRALQIRPNRVKAVRLGEIRDRIADGQDPLGEAYCTIRSAETRRRLGQTYTPPQIVDAMLTWAQGEIQPTRVIDPGSGSARFSVAAGRLFPNSELVATEVDPLAALMSRAHLTAAGLAGRSYVFVGDYRYANLGRVEGPTLFVGNPPYVRHHLLGPEAKHWLAKTARAFGHRASGLSGLHVYFFLATLLHGSPGDVGSFVTAAEWLDVNYGQLLRELLLSDLGGVSLHMIDPEAHVFRDAQATAVITNFRLGDYPRSIRLRRVGQVKDLASLRSGRPVARNRLVAARRWTPLVRSVAKPVEGWVELGELCRVHRGTVTGANAIWVAGANSDVPQSVLFPSVTRARELFAAGEELTEDRDLRRVIDLPADLDQLAQDERLAVERLLSRARAAGAAESYVARKRQVWWRVGLREPAPILATYMARRAPAFVRNQVGAYFINIAHGIYPREPMTDLMLDRLATVLRSTTNVDQGRTYAGGLTKFEPREMERLLIPGPDVLAA